MDRPIPRHIAVIMDGNGRWAKAQGLSRAAGHRKGGVAAKKLVETCLKYPEIQELTLFAFGQENWRRPAEEVSGLMTLFLQVLRREIKNLAASNVRLRFMGERAALNERLQVSMARAEELTQGNQALTLNIAVNYSGRWDIVEAAKTLATRVRQQELSITEIDEAQFDQALTLPFDSDPDLFIRTSGEQRISNFLLWQLAYTELFFYPGYWPDFDAQGLELALDAYAHRRRRFGHTDEQLENSPRA